MMESKKCPSCGAKLPADAPAGICPKCLLRAGMRESKTDAAEDSVAATIRKDQSTRARSPIHPASDADVLQAGTAPPIGTKVRYFGDYELDQEIARGGMGVVYLARQVTLNRRVAIKMILPAHLADETTVKRFYAEAEAAANLKHPNIVSIHEIGSHNGQHYFSMDFIDGENLAEHARGKPLAVKKAAAIVKTVAEAIQYAHQRGVLHRDLKPSNVLIDREGRPHVTDFGLAKLVGRDSTLTQSGQIMGTPSYMSPEQAAGRQDQVGPHTDVYALGAILYDLLTGRPPFQSGSSMDTLLQVMEVEPVSARRRNANVPSDLDTICLKCLEKLPRHRYHSARELAEELGRFLNQEPIHARPASSVRKLIVWARRRPGQLAAISALVFSVLVGGVYYLFQENAFLRALQTTPDLVREPGARVAALETWSFCTTWVYLAAVLFSVWIQSRIRGKWRRSTNDSLSVQPFYPLGSRVRIWTAWFGLLLTLFCLAYAMKLIEAHVWEGGGAWFDVGVSFGMGWFGLWLLMLVAADYRRSLFGMPQRSLTREQKDDIERALFQHDLREAMRLYQHVFSDASRTEAQAFVLQRSDEMHRQRPNEFAALPRLWDLNWRYIAICVLIEVPVVVAFWLFMQPASPFAIVVGCGLGAAFSFGLIASGRLGRTGRRALAISVCMGMMFAGAFAYSAGSHHLSGRSVMLGVLCGVALMISGLTRKRQPNSP